MALAGRTFGVREGHLAHSLETQLGIEGKEVGALRGGGRAARDVGVGAC